MSTKKSSFSKQELRLIVGFGFFVELLLAYVLLIDAPIVQIAKLQSQLTKSRMAYEELRGASTLQSRTSTGKELHLPPPLTLSAGDSPNLLIHRYLDDQLTQSGATLLQASIRPAGTELATTSASFQAMLTLGGSYEAIDQFLKHLEQPKYLLSLDKYSVQLGEGGNLRANMAISFYTQRR